jgi:hypothetical protein
LDRRAKKAKNGTGSSYEYADNEVLNASLWGIAFSGSLDSSRLRIEKNTFTGTNGPYFDDSVTFSGDMKCQLLKNGVTNVSDVGIYLGPGTRDCLVVCKTRKDTVTNLGMDNKVNACQEVGKTLNRGVPPNILHGKAKAF